GSGVTAAEKRVKQLELLLLDQAVDAAKYDYQSKTIPGSPSAKVEPYTYSPIEELIRWRLWARTGGGLMAELGSHQLDASGIFCGALRTDRQKAKARLVMRVRQR